MDRCREAADRIHQIEARQDEVLRQLAELELRTERVLAEHAPSPASSPPSDPSLHVPAETISAEEPEAT